MLEEGAEGFEKAFTVVRGRADHFLLQSGEFAGLLLEEQEEDHADAGEGCFDFVGDGGEDVHLHVVEPAEAGDIGEDDAPGGIHVLHGGEAEDAGEVIDFAFPDAEEEGLVEFVGEILLAGGEAVVEGLFEFCGKAVGGAEGGEDGLRLGVDLEEISVVVENDDGVGEGGEEGAVAGVEIDDMAVGFVVESAEFGGHVVVGAGESADFVVASHGEGEFEVAVFDFADRVGEGGEGAEGEVVELPVEDEEDEEGGGGEEADIEGGVAGLVGEAGPFGDEAGVVESGDALADAGDTAGDVGNAATIGAGHIGAGRNGIGGGLHFGEEGVDEGHQFRHGLRFIGIFHLVPEFLAGGTEGGTGLGHDGIAGLDGAAGGVCGGLQGVAADDLGVEGDGMGGHDGLEFLVEEALEAFGVGVDEPHGTEAQADDDGEDHEDGGSEAAADHGDSVWSKSSLRRLR